MVLVLVASIHLRLSLGITNIFTPPEGRTLSDWKRYNSSRTNSEANQIANQARVYKKANNVSQAYDLYTKAVQLDPYNHEYFHHRAETNMKAGRCELAMWDAQFGLDLCVNNIARWGRMNASLCCGVH